MTPVLKEFSCDPALYIKLSSEKPLRVDGREKAVTSPLKGHEEEEAIQLLLTSSPQTTAELWDY